MGMYFLYLRHIEHIICDNQIQTPMSLAFCFGLLSGRVTMFVAATRKNKIKRGKKRIFLILST